MDVRCCGYVGVDEPLELPKGDNDNVWFKVLSDFDGPEILWDRVLLGALL